MNTETQTTIGELMHKPLSRAADYAGALGFSRGSLNLILHYVKEQNLERIKELAHSALENIEDVFIKHQVQ
jgi:hypothetical protein